MGKRVMKRLIMKRIIQKGGMYQIPHSFLLEISKNHTGSHVLT
jgi:hypothetical protein